MHIHDLNDNVIVQRMLFFVFFRVVFTSKLAKCLLYILIHGFYFGFGDYSDKYIDFTMMFIFLFVLSLRFEAKEFLILNI